MVIEFDFQDGVCILRLRGRFATGIDSAYLQAKTDELKTTGCAKAIADFTAVPYIDSTGIGFLVSTYTSLTRAGGKFALAGLSPRVRHILEITRILGVIPAYDDVASAVAALKSEGAAGGV